jgi:hypothetical protein
MYQLTVQEADNKALVMALDMDKLERHMKLALVMALDMDKLERHMKLGLVMVAELVQTDIRDAFYAKSADLCCLQILHANKLINFDL